MAFLGARGVVLNAGFELPHPGVVGVAEDVDSQLIVIVDFGQSSDVLYYTSDDAVKAALKIVDEIRRRALFF